MEKFTKNLLRVSLSILCLTIPISTLFSGTLGNTNITTTDFSQVGKGSVARSVQNKFEELVSVKDFGAVGDGTTDDTNAFKNALATGKRVYVPQPSNFYKITDTLILNTGYQALIGDENMPQIQIHLASNVNKSAVEISEPESGMNQYTRVENLYLLRKVIKPNGTIEDGCPNYNSVITEELAGVVVSGHGSNKAASVAYTRISNLRVANFAVGFFFSDCVGVTVHKCFTQLNDSLYTNFTNTSDGRPITSDMWGVGYYFDATRFGAGQISPLASIEIVETDDVRFGDPKIIKSVSYLIIGPDIRDIFFQRAESAKADYGWYIDGKDNHDLNWDLHIIRPIIDAFKTNGIFATNIDGVGGLNINGGYLVGATNAGPAIQIRNSNGITVTGGTQILGISNNTISNTDEGVRFDNCNSCLVVGNRFSNLQYAVSLFNTNFTTVQGNVISAAKTEDENLPILHEAIRLLNMSNNNTIIGNTIRGLGIKTNPNQKYSHGIKIENSNSAKNIIIGNSIDSSTVRNPITGDTSETILANNITS